MNQDQREKLSALMDGAELSSRELDALLADNEASHTWARYHLVRDCIQNELHENYLDISSSVSAAIADEPAILAPRNLKAKKPWQAAVGFAMAASVFAVAILGWQALQSPTALSTDSPFSVAQQSANANTTQVAPINRVVANPAFDEERARLEEMLINHTEAVSANGINVMMPYSRVVSARLELPLEQVPVDSSTLDEKNEPKENNASEINKEMKEQP